MGEKGRAEGAEGVQICSNQKKKLEHSFLMVSPKMRLVLTKQKHLQPQ
jgi:hypothetical protein